LAFTGALISADRSVGAAAVAAVEVLIVLRTSAPRAAIVLTDMTLLRVLVSVQFHAMRDILSAVPGNGLAPTATDATPASFTSVVAAVCQVGALRQDHGKRGRRTPTAEGDP